VTLETIDIILPLERSEDETAWCQAAAAKLGVPVARIGGARLRKHSIDARHAPSSAKDGHTWWCS